jgi:trimethylamine--corrinoid protein Co-methyltransferase
MNGEVESKCRPSYRFLTEEQINHFHKSTLELLGTVGVKILHPEALDMLARVGCKVKDDHVVLIPVRIIEDAIRSAPSRIVIYNRMGLEAMDLQGRNIHFGLGTDLAKHYDLKTGELRESRLEDVGTAARVADVCENIDFIASYAIPFDSPPNLMYIDSFKKELENSAKPVFFTAAVREDLSVIHQMAAAVAGGEEALKEKPALIHYSEPMSPLVHTESGVGKLFYCADNRIPVLYIPGMMSGASAPVTLAGAIVMGNAEALSGIVLHQLRAPGSPIISGFGTSTMDLHFGTCIYGCPEYRLALSASADLYHHYSIPVFGTAGASDSNCLDQQAGMEWGISLLNDALNGINLIHDVGYLGQGLIGHPAGIIMCDEIISYVKRFIRGFDMDPEHIALDVIKQVGHQGHFLATKHTKRFHREEHWRPKYCNRSPVQDWIDSGRPDWKDLAIEKALEILDNHNPEPVSDDILAVLGDIREKAEKDLSNREFEC